MPAVSMITLTMWYFYDPFMHLDWENYPEYWPLSIVAAIYCNNYDFSSLKLKRVWTPQLDKTALFFVTISSAVYVTFLVISFERLDRSAKFFLFSFNNIKTRCLRRSKVIFTIVKNIRGPSQYKLPFSTLYKFLYSTVTAVGGGATVFGGLTSCISLSSVCSKCIILPCL